MTPHNDRVKTQFMQLLRRAITSEASPALHRTVEADPRLSILTHFHLFLSNIDQIRNHGREHLGRHYTVDPNLPKLFCKELTPKEGYYAPNYFGPRDWVDRCSKLQV